MNLKHSKSLLHSTLQVSQSLTPESSGSIDQASQKQREAWAGGDLLRAICGGWFYLGADPRLVASHLLNTPLPREVGSGSTAALDLPVPPHTTKESVSGMQLVQCVSVSVRSLKELAISANTVSLLTRVPEQIYEALAHVVQYSL